MCQSLVFYFLFSWLMFLFCSVCGVVQILGKCEFLNPRGSVKDRVAVKIIEEVNYYYL
jgi:cysteine synthase